MEVKKQKYPPKRLSGKDGLVQSIGFGLNIGEYFDGNFGVCDCCHKYAPLKDIVDVYENGHVFKYCNNCRKDKCEVCANCGKSFLYSEDSLRYVNDIGNICGECYRSLECFQCDYCEEHFQDRDYGSGGYCRFCEEESSSSCDYIRKYHDAPFCNFTSVKTILTMTVPYTLDSN